MKISLFNRANDRAAQPKEVSWPEVVTMLRESVSTAHPDPEHKLGDAQWREAKEGLPLWSPATFRDGWSNKANVIEVSSIVADVEPETAQEMAEKLAGVKAQGSAYLFHTSVSHGRHQGVRGRLIVPCEPPIPGADYERVFPLALAKLGVLNTKGVSQCKNADRGWFRPVAGAIFEESEGGILDVSDLLAAPMPKAAPKAATTAPQSGGRSIAPEVEREIVERYQAAREGKSEGENRAQKALANYLVRAGVLFDDAARVHGEATGRDDWAVRDAFRRMDTDEPMGGVPMIAEHVDADFALWLTRALPLGEAELATPPSIVTGGGGFDLVSASSLAEPLGAVDWLIKGLDIAPGAPTLAAGSNFTGKTMAFQSAAVSIAAGQPVWGHFPCRQGAVVHLDFEQGRRLTATRYQRLARAMGLDLRDLPIHAAILPRLKLDGRDARDALRRVIEETGAVLVVGDSLRACAPTLEENSSEMRQPLDLMTTVSEETGAAFLVISHARKPSKDAVGGARNAIRGSSAIVDACSSVLVFAAEKGEPITVMHEKARVSGRLHDDFTLHVDDVAVGGDPLGGLAVRFQAGEAVEARAHAADQLKTAATRAEVLAYVKAHPGCVREELKGVMKVRPTTTLAVIESLLREGVIYEGAAGKGRGTGLHQKLTNGAGVVA